MFFGGVVGVHIPFYDYSKHNYMTLPIILMVAAMSCGDHSVCVDVQTLETELFTQKDAVAAAEWNVQLGQSHNDTIWPSGACVHVEPCHLLSDGIQVKTYFK